jgi:hypothetical protein
MPAAIHSRIMAFSPNDVLGAWRASSRSTW